VLHRRFLLRTPRAAHDIVRAQNLVVRLAHLIMAAVAGGEDGAPSWCVHVPVGGGIEDVTDSGIKPPTMKNNDFVISRIRLSVACR